MNFDKKVVGLAVAGVLGSGAAGAVSAAVDLATGTGGPLKYASEIIVSPSAALGVAAGNGATSPIGAGSLFLGNTPFVRFDLSNGATFGADPTLSVPRTCDNGLATVANTVAGSLVVPVSGQSSALFQLTGTAVAGSTCAFAPSNAAVSLVMGGGASVRVVNQNPVALTYGIYNNFTGAQSRTGVVTEYSANYISFAPALAFSVTTNAAVANVSATPPFGQFVGGASAALGTVNLVAATDVYGVGGASTAYAGIVSSSSKLIFSGDFSARGTVSVGGTAIASSNINNSSATFAANAPLADASVAYAVNGTTPIPAAIYTVTFNPVSADAAVYTVSPSTLTLGSVTRNGAVLRAPLSQIPAGWTSRMALMNNSSGLATYNIALVNEEGNPVTPISPGALTGTITANSVKTLDMKQVVAAFPAGAPSTRFGVVVSINVPQRQAEGLIQLINTQFTTGGAAPTNYVMVPGNYSN